jgi:DNA-binding transcriptional ArsR family regulator
VARGENLSSEGTVRFFRGGDSEVMKIFSGNRRRILQTLYILPASSVSRISREVGLTPNTVKWHLNALKKAEFISEDRVDNKAVFYPCNYLDRSEILLLTVLSDESSSRIFREVYEKPGLTQKEIKNALGLTQNTTGYFLRKLTHIGAIDEIQNGKFKHYYPSKNVIKRFEERKARSQELAYMLIQRLKSSGIEVTDVVVNDLSFNFKVQQRHGAEPVEFQSNPFMHLLS